jgi:SAM-dependent methyltransferase
VDAEFNRLDLEAVDNGVLRGILKTLTPDFPLQAHDYLIIEDKDFKGKILDVGSGPGVLSIVSKLKNPELDISIIDGSPLNIKIAATLATMVNLTPKDLTMYVGLIGSKLECKYDTIVMNHVFEHVDDLENALAWAVHFINKEGTIFIAVPYKDSHWSPNHKHFFKLKDDNDDTIYPETNLMDIDTWLKEKNIPADIHVFDESKIDKRHPFDSRGQLDMIIKIKVKKNG